VLHGGRQTSTAPVRALQLAVLRMTPFAMTLARAGNRHGLAVARLRYRVRGWNAEQRAPVSDVLGALGRIADAYPGVPVALVGHSMGGRAAIHAAGHAAVASVVGLAPWIEPGDPIEPLRDRDLLLAHGTDDHTTNPRRSAEFVRAAQPVARSAAYVRIAADGHAMLRRASMWHDLATGFVLATLCGAAPADTVGAAAARVLGKVLAGGTENAV
jgi:dienelactone hydrolase